MPYPLSLCRDISALIQKDMERILALRSERTLKVDGSYVTMGDLLCQKIVMDYVASLPEKFEVLSEEMDRSAFIYDPSKNYVVLDPVDGTENFTSGLKEWGVSVSVFRRGTHVESMLLLPEMGLTLISGGTVSKNHSRIHGLSSSLSPKNFQALEDDHEYRITGCCVYNMYNVVTGSFATFENPRGAWVWDILAGLNLAREHGLRVEVDGETYQGEFLDPTKKYRFKLANKYEQRL